MGCEFKHLKKSKYTCHVGLLNYQITHGIPGGVWVMRDDVVTPSHQALVDSGEEGIGLGWAEDALQGGAADLSHALRAALQQEGQQGAHHMGGIQLLCAEDTNMQQY